jgi:uncharacterized protein
MKLLPREEKFFDFFLQQVHLIVEAASLFYEASLAGNAQLKTAAVQIKALEQKGDEVIHEIFRRLNSTFITPLDPEDIHSLSSHLDDVLDGIEDAAYRVVSYRVDPIPKPAQDLCGIVLTCSKALERAFIELEKDRLVLEHCIEVNRLEESADVVLRAAIADLFDNEKDAVQIIKLKEIYELLEGTTDRCEDVADVLQNVVVKNS